MKTMIFGLLLVTASVIGLAGCNTIAGAGQDIQNAGEGIENSADGAQQ